MPLDKKDFKNKIKKFVAYEREIKKLNEEIKKLREEKEKIMPDITKFMLKKNLNELSINNHYIIKLNTSNNYQGLTKNYIQENLSKYLKSETHGEKITQFLYDNRSKSERINLSLTEIN